jgi:hypothetical protein
VAPQRGADGSPSTSNAWHHPLRPTPPLVRPSPSSQEELRKLIQTEVASRLAPYERLLEEAKTATAGKDAEIAGLKEELAKVKAQKKSSEAPAAEPASPTDPKCQPGTQDSSWRHLQREFRQLRQEATLRESMYLCNGMKERQSRMSTELVLQQQEIVALQKQLMKEEQPLTREWRCTFPSPQAGGGHSLSEPLKEKGQNQQGNLHGRPATAATSSRIRSGPMRSWGSSTRRRSLVHLPYPPRPSALRMRPTSSCLPVLAQTALCFSSRPQRQ